MQTWLGYLFFTVIVGGGQIAAADAPFDVIIKGGTVYDGAVAPGFINMLSWSTESLIQDGRRKAKFGRASRPRSWAKANRWGR
jgi:hypothetical protein